MNTKFLMMSSAIILGIMGLGLTFLPEELSQSIGIGTHQISLLILQILGSLYLGLAILNWMAKDNLIGGIYSRPLLIGNLIHFLVSSFALIKIVSHIEQAVIIIPLVVIYSVFALCFGYRFIVDPNRVSKVV